MKAKEYAQILKDGNYGVEFIDKIVKGLLDEIVSLSKARKVGSKSGLDGVVREIRQKWVAVSNRSDGHLNKDGFDKYLISKKFLNMDCSINENLFKEKIM
jgi:hypothetical protein